MFKKTLSSCPFSFCILATVDFVTVVWVILRNLQEITVRNTWAVFLMYD